MKKPVATDTLFAFCHTTSIKSSRFSQQSYFHQLNRFGLIVMDCIPCFFPSVTDVVACFRKTFAHFFPKIFPVFTEIAPTIAAGNLFQFFLIQSFHHKLLYTSSRLKMVHHPTFGFCTFVSRNYRLCSFDSVIFPKK